MAQKFIAIQDEVIEKYNITLDPCSKCWGRMHAHVKERKVCKWHQKNSIACTFDLLHEIGHIQTTKTSMRRCEAEYYATVWAINEAEAYGLEIPAKIIDNYQRYIDRERDRGVRRGGSGYSSDMRLRR